MKFNRTVMVFTLLFVFSVSCISFGQISNSISIINNSKPVQNSNLTFDIELFQANTISKITLFYKLFGEASFRSRDVIISGVKAQVTIPQDEIIPPSLEYYFIIELKDGNTESYPIDYLKTHVTSNLRIEPFLQTDNDIIFLSPEPGFKSTSDNLLISISLFNCPDNVLRDSTKIYIDGNNVSPNALFAGDLINYFPDNFPPKLNAGAHILKIDLYDTLNSVYKTYNYSFTTISEEQASSEKNSFTYHADATAGLRNEKMNGKNTFYNNLGINFNGAYGDWKINSNLYLTSEEKSYLQPYNRYYLSAQNDYLTLSLGDIFPRFSSLILDGKRVRGVYGDIKAGGFEIKSTYGEITRGTDGRILELIKYDTLASDIIDIDSAKYGAARARAVLGTYKRNLFALRAAAGSDNGLMWGISYLHAKDDINSIEFGIKPKENLVLGTDFAWNIDNRNIVVAGQGAFSFANNDISSGELSDDLIDSVFSKVGGYGGGVDPKKIKDIKKIFGRFITVNQFIVPLNPLEMPTLAAEASVSLNYFNNSIKTSYIYRGNDFSSAGQSFTKNDVAGIDISDRIRFMNDKIFLSLSYESLQDNLQKTKIATTDYNTFGSSVSFFPRNELPNIVVGYNRNSNNNDVSRTDTVNNYYLIDDITNRFYTQISYDFEYSVKHQASLNLSVSNREDNSISDYDVNNVSVYLGLNSYWTKDLISFFSLSVNQSKIKTISYNYTGFSFGGKKTFPEQNLELTTNINPIFGELKRVSYEISAQYLAYTNLYVNGQLRYLAYPDAANDLIVSLSARYALN